MSDPIQEARRLLGDAPSVVVGPGCGSPTTWLRRLAELGEPSAPVELWSGLLLGDVPIEAMSAGALDYHTWHVTAATRNLVAAGLAAFHPMRGADVPHHLVARGVDVAIVRVSPPDAHGRVSLGTSVSFTRPMVESARVVLGEVDPAFPRTRGMSEVARSDFDLLIDSEDPTPIYPSRAPGSVAKRIAANLIPLLPEQPAIQLGIGEIPEAVTGLLADADLGKARVVGMATDAMVELFEIGVLDPTATVPEPAIAAVELMGTRALFDHADDNPTIGVYPVSLAADAPALAGIDRFVSINSALEVDLLGQVSAEWAGGRQLSGAGGSIDFSEGARASCGGLRILALPSTSRGRSRIVARLASGTPVTLSRHQVDYVVTEHGVADLRGASVSERVERLVAVADPAERDALADAAGAAVDGDG